MARMLRHHYASPEPGAAPNHIMRLLRNYFEGDIHNLGGIDIPGAKILAHSPRLNQTRSKLNSDYSDRLLAANDKSRSLDSLAWLLTPTSFCTFGIDSLGTNAT
jgi:hypothetical protein